MFLDLAIMVNEGDSLLLVFYEAYVGNKNNYKYSNLYYSIHH